MPTESVRFGPDHLRRALREAAAGRYTSAQPLIFSDLSEKGLTIRVQGKSAAWYLKYGKTLKRLGGVGSPDVDAAKREAKLLYTLRDAKEMAERVRELLKEGKDPSDYINSRNGGATHDAAVGKAESEAAKDKGAWTLGKLVNEYIERKISQPKITKTSVKPAKASTIKDVRQILLHKDLADLRNELARDITREQVEEVRDKWLAEAPSRQRKLINYLTGAYRWARKKHGAAGLHGIPPWWLEIEAEEYASEEAIAEANGEEVGRPLTPAEIAKLLFIAEKFRVVPGRKLAIPTDEVTLSYLWWVALTAQRTHAAAVVRTARVIDNLATDGWYDVQWLPADMKSGRHHVLPIPPEVHRRTIGRALAAPDRRESAWVFPSTREKDRGKDSWSDKSVGDRALNSLLDRLRGKDNERKGDRSGYDLLAEAGLPHFTLHSLRDSMTTHLANTDLPRGTASAILDHAMPVEKDGEAEVTRRHYNKSHRLPLKFAGLQEWSKVVLQEYEKLLAKERADRGYGPLAISRSGRHQGNTKIAPKDLWVFDEHLPREEAEKPPVVIDLNLIRKAAASTPASDLKAHDDRMDDVG